MSISLSLQCLILVLYPYMKSLPTLIMYSTYYLVGNSIISIGLDEDMVYWTNGFVINSINRTTNSRIPFSSDVFDDGKVVSLHSLSPGQQPQFCK